MSAIAPATVAQSAPSASRLTRLMWSSIGLKLVMAVTGVILCFFVLVHMLGNLTAFSGASALDAYAKALRKIPALLWAARLGLLAAVGLHIWAYLVTLRRSWIARPQGYRETEYEESTISSRTMRWTGPILAAFVIYHILHMTTGTVHPQFEPGKVYQNLIAGLSVLPVALFYIVAILCLALHLFHGVWSTFQTLGISQPRYASFGRRFAIVFTVIVVAGFIAVPVAVLTGFLH